MPFKPQIKGLDYYETGGAVTETDPVWESEKANYALISGLHFPIYDASGTQYLINLSADQKLPIYDASGTQFLIALTT